MRAKIVQCISDMMTPIRRSESELYLLRAWAFPRTDEAFSRRFEVSRGRS